MDEAESYTTANFGCDLLWDKTYSWSINDNVPELSVKMTDTYADEPQPWVELTYNGNNGLGMSTGILATLRACVLSMKTTSRANHQWL